MLNYSVAELRETQKNENTYIFYYAYPFTYAC